MTPTLHVTNASSRKLHHGRVYNIMAAPRRWERFEGNVEALTPRWEDVVKVQQALMSWGAYRARYEAGILMLRNRDEFMPGALRSGELILVDGDTLVCACAKAAADRGECHRVWAAEFLRQAGWQVVLDGRELV